MNNAQERRNLIAKMVEERDQLTIADLIDRFQVTDTSIRHDLSVLEEAGRLVRVRGGAVSSSASRPTSTFAVKAKEKQREKKRIGRAAAELIQTGDVVLFDSGSTVAQVAAQMPGRLKLPHAITVVSHSLAVIQEVSSWPQPHCICLGGLFLPEFQASVGPMTLAGLRELNAQIAFLGCDGLTVEGGLTTPHQLIAEVGSAMAARAKRVVAVADTSKLGMSGFTRIVGIDAIHVLVTDTLADPDLLEEVRRQGVEVIVA
ncbi:MAG: DeoR/GlpR family DNA-binding transcription regulator [Acidimicrobiales bacterium]